MRPTLRICALCGKSEGPGKPAMLALSLVVKWAKDSGIALKCPESAFLHFSCHRKLVK
jgi:hypothetical protein